MAGVEFSTTRKSAPASPGSPSSPLGEGTTGKNAGRVVDPASFLRIGLDPALSQLTPTHWAYEMIQAILSGDADFVDMTVKSHAQKFDVNFLTEPLVPSGQTMLHVSALMNRPAIIEILLSTVDRSLAVQSTEQKTSIRHESVTSKSGDADPSHQRHALAKELDKIDRLYHIQCEQQYLTIVATLDAGSRTVLHYSAAARGVMVSAVLRYKSSRFRTPMTSDLCPPSIPLFPENGHVSPITGDLWQPEWYEFPQDHPAQKAPDGFIAVKDLMRARNDPLFVDAKDRNAATPLHYATVSNDVKGIRCLLEFGAEAFLATKQGARPLDLADNKTVRTALMPMENALQLSVGMKIARPGMKMPMGASTVSFAREAAASARDKVGEGNFDYDDGTTTVAMRKGDAESALVFLVGTGEDINGRTGIKLQAPLHVAAEKGNVDIVQLLLTNGAIVDVVDVNGCSPMHLAAELGTEKHMAIVQLLFDSGADVNATSSVRKTPLHVAAAGGPNFTAGHRLVPAEGVDENGEPILLPAVEEAPGGKADGNSTMITLLTRLGANLEAQDIEGATPLISAAKRGNHLAVQTLLTLGSRLYACNIRGHTALHVAAFGAQIAVVHQLTRWDAEVGKLKFMLDSSGRSSYDLAADPPTREALHTLFEACATGSLDLVQSVQRQARLLPSVAAAPWLPVRVWETTRVMRRTALHCTMTGAAKAMAMFRKDWAAKQGKPEPLGGTKVNKVADALSKAIVQQRERSYHPDPAKGTGLPAHRIAPSAARIVSGVGLRFVAVPIDVRAPFPAYEYLAWGGNFADVVLTFPELKDAHALGQYVDRYAFVPRPGAHKAFINKALLGDVTRSEAAAQRVVPGNELTSTQTEKEFGRVADYLIRAGVDPNAGDVDGVTALMLACKFGLLFVVRKLLLRGADPGLTDAMGNTALHYCRAYNQATAAEILAEFTSDGEAGGSVLDHVPNADGKSPAECSGLGIALFPESSDRLVMVPRQQNKSKSLHITKAF